MARTKEIGLFKECDKRAHPLLKTKPIKNLSQKHKNEISNHHLIKLPFWTSVWFYLFKKLKFICKHCSFKIDERTKYEKLWDKGIDRLNK